MAPRREKGRRRETRDTDQASSWFRSSSSSLLQSWRSPCSCLGHRSVFYLCTRIECSRKRFWRSVTCHEPWTTSNLSHMRLTLKTFPFPRSILHFRLSGTPLDSRLVSEPERQSQSWRIAILTDFRDWPSFLLTLLYPLSGCFHLQGAHSNSLMVVQAPDSLEVSMHQRRT